MSTKGWEAYFKAILFQPVHHPINQVYIAVHLWSETPLDLVPEDLPTAQYVLRKVFVEEGTGLVSEPTLRLGRESKCVDAHTWALRQLRGTKKRVHLVLENNPENCWGDKEQFLSELAHQLSSGTFVSIDMIASFPMSVEIAVAISMSQGLRALSISHWPVDELPSFSYSYEEEDSDGFEEYENVSQDPRLTDALLSPTATHTIESIETWIMGSHRVPRQYWGFLEIKSLKIMYLHAVPELSPSHISELKTHLLRRAQLGYPPIQTIDVGYWREPRALRPLIVAVAEVSPTTVVKYTCCV